MTYILITYYSAGAQGNELQLSVFGWRKYFRGDYKLIIVSDIDRCVSGEDIIWIKEPRVEPISGQYHPHLDVMNRFMKAIKAVPEMNGFVWAADDNFLIKPINGKWLKELRYQNNEYIINGEPSSLHHFAKEKLKTREILDREKLPHRNWTTHIPCYFEVDKFIALTDKYDLAHNSYILEDLYYNTYFPQEKAELASVSKFMLLKEEDALSMTENIKNKTWICGSVPGFSESMQNILAAFYGIKLINNKVMYKKTYEAKRTELFLSVVLKNGESKRISFNLKSNGRSSLTTSDEKIQYALEHHVGYGTKFVLVESINLLNNKKAEKKVIVNTAPEAPKMEEKIFSSMADAKDYIADTYGVSRTKMTNMLSIIREAKRFNFVPTIKK